MKKTPQKKPAPVVQDNSWPLSEIDHYLLAQLEAEGLQPAPEKRLTNNIVFRKLKIALNLKDEDILEIMALAHLSISKHELSAFFRKPDHKPGRINLGSLELNH